LGSAASIKAETTTVAANSTSEPWPVKRSSRKASAASDGACAEPPSEQRGEHGWVSDVCLKRKIRNYVQATTNEGIFIEHGGAPLNHKNRDALQAAGVEPKEATAEERANARQIMC
jgi:CRISPR/Cas system type I-B associated protein Csh2 (Cas7 group RAMP superfamily)